MTCHTHGLLLSTPASPKLKMKPTARVQKQRCPEAQHLLGEDRKRHPTRGLPRGRPLAGRLRMDGALGAPSSQPGAPTPDPTVPTLDPTAPLTPSPGPPSPGLHPSPRGSPTLTPPDPTLPALDPHGPPTPEPHPGCAARRSRNCRARGSAGGRRAHGEARRAARTAGARAAAAAEAAGRARRGGRRRRSPARGVLGAAEAASRRRTRAGAKDEPRPRPARRRKSRPRRECFRAGAVRARGAGLSAPPAGSLRGQRGRPRQILLQDTQRRRAPRAALLQGGTSEFLRPPPLSAPHPNAYPPPPACTLPRVPCPPACTHPPAYTPPRRVPPSSGVHSTTCTPSPSACTHTRPAACPPPHHTPLGEQPVPKARHCSGARKLGARASGPGKELSRHQRGHFGPPAMLPDLHPTCPSSFWQNF